MYFFCYRAIPSSKSTVSVWHQCRFICSMLYFMTDLQYGVTDRHRDHQQCGARTWAWLKGDLLTPAQLCPVCRFIRIWCWPWLMCNCLGVNTIDSAQQKPNCCFAKQLGYCSCVTILPMLIQRMWQFVTNKLANWLLGRVYILQSIISLRNPRYDA